MTTAGPGHTTWISAIKYSLNAHHGHFKVVENVRRVLVNNARWFKLFLLMAVVFLLVSLTLFISDKERQRIQISHSSFQQVIAKGTAFFQEEGQSSSSELATEDPTQKLRQKRVEDVCSWAQKQTQSSETPQTMGVIPPKMMKHIYVDDKYKFLYCEVPKVACTNFKAIMELLTGKVNATNPNELQSALVHGDYQKQYLRKLSNYTSTEIAHRIDKYYKFMFVREPLERILSAYRNKFTVAYSDYFNIRFGRSIVRKYRKHPTNESLAKGHDVTFTEFVRYLTDPVTLKKVGFNAHWQHYYKLCLPCQIKYNYIGKYEHLQEEVHQVLHQLGLESMLKFPDNKPHSRTTGGVVKTFFKNITSQDVHKLWKLYSVDYSMFGYHYPSVH